MTNYYTMQIIITMNNEKCEGEMSTYHIWDIGEDRQCELLRHEDLTAAETMRRVIKLRNLNGGKRKALDEEEHMILPSNTTWSEWDWSWDHEYSDKELEEME